MPREKEKKPDATEILVGNYNKNHLFPSMENPVTYANNLVPPPSWQAEARNLGNGSGAQPQTVTDSRALFALDIPEGMGGPTITNNITANNNQTTEIQDEDTELNNNLLLAVIVIVVLRLVFGGKS